MTGVVETRDVFSELPDHVLVHILSFLPTLDSVRTLLLRRFDDLWTLVPKLDFQSSNFGQLKSFVLFVRHVMLLYQAPSIHSFILEFGNDCRWDCDIDVVEEIQTWIKRALHKEPKRMTLYFHGDAYFPLPLCFFLNQSLTDLTLVGCILKERRHERVHMGSLRSLTLVDFPMDEGEEKGNETFNEIISGCPSLELLNLAFCYVDDIVIHSEVLQELVLNDNRDSDFCVKISCPNVEVLHLRCSHLPCYKLLDTSSVYDATIRFCGLRENLFESYEDIHLLLKSLRDVEVLTLDGLLLEDKIFPPNRWQAVTMNGIVSSEPCIVWICDLLRKSPILEELTIIIKDGCEIEWKKDEICPQRAFPSPWIPPYLREVHIVVGKKYDDVVVLQLIEFFLKSAVLIELVISPNYKQGERLTEILTERKKNVLLKIISGFTKASSNTRITIN